MPRTLLSAALIASTLFFAAGAHADDRGRSQRYERYDRDHDRSRDHRWDNRRDYRGRDNHRWNNDRRDYRYYRPSYRTYHAPSRYYWRQNSRWHYGPVPRGYRGNYYSYRPRDSYGQLIISVPLW